MINFKTAVFTTMLSFIPTGTGHVAQKQVNEIQPYLQKSFEKSIAKDTFVKSDTDTADLIIKQIEKEERLKKEVQNFVGKYFDEEDTKYLMNQAETPEAQIYLAQQIKTNLSRGEQKLSSYELANFVNTKDEDKDFVHTLLTAKQTNKKFYSGGALTDINFLVKISDYPWFTRDLATAMMKVGYPEEGLVEIPKAIISPEYREWKAKTDLAIKLVQQKDKNGDFLTPAVIINKIKALKLPREIISF